METIENPVIGEKVVFITTAAESNGAKSLFEVHLGPKGGNPLHYHKRFSESFCVLEGELNVQVGKQIKTLRSGDVALAPANTIHRFFNSSGKPVKFTCELSPASPGFENVLRIGFGLASDGRAAKNGMPKNVWHMAALMEMGEGSFVGVFSLFEKFFRWMANTSKGKRVTKELLETYGRLGKLEPI